MTWHARCFVIPQVGIDLKGARSSIAQVIQCRGEPAGHNAEHRDQGQGGQHADTKEEQGMQARTRPRRLLWPWRVRESFRHRGGTAYPGCRGAPTARLGSIAIVLLRSVVNSLWLAQPRSPVRLARWDIYPSAIFIDVNWVRSPRAEP